MNNLDNLIIPDEKENITKNVSVFCTRCGYMGRINRTLKHTLFGLEMLDKRCPQCKSVQDTLTINIERE